MKKSILVVLVPMLLWVLAAIVSVAVPNSPVSGHVAVIQSVYNVVDFGAVGDGNPANAAINTTAFQNALATGGTVYVPTGKGFVVNNGTLTISTPGQLIYGDAGMGSNPDRGCITSTVIGSGKGNTFTVTGFGSSVRGLAFKPNVVGEQNTGDAFVAITGGSQVYVSSCCFSSPVNGVVVNIPAGQGGEYWIRDCLSQGKIGVSVINANTGGGTLQCSHIIAYADDPQPPYGIVVTNAGELIVDNGTDIINCGNCLAIVPGLNGTKNQNVIATAISDSLFDGGNGQGCVYVCPTNGAFVSRMAFVNVWTSTANNGNGTFPTNGFTFDGTQTVPILPGVKPIQDVCLTNCLGQHFINHCGLYAKGVQGLSVQNSTFGGNFNGIQIAPGCSQFLLTGNKCGNFAIPAVDANGGNKAYGILIEPNAQFNISNNLLYGNGLGGLLNQAVNPQQFVFGNLQ